MYLGLVKFNNRLYPDIKIVVVYGDVMMEVRDYHGIVSLCLVVICVFIHVL